MYFVLTIDLYGSLQESGEVVMKHLFGNLYLRFAGGELIEKDVELGLSINFFISKSVAPLAVLGPRHFLDEAQVCQSLLWYH